MMACFSNKMAGLRGIVSFLMKGNSLHTQSIFQHLKTEFSHRLTHGKVIRNVLGMKPSIVLCI